MTIPDAIKLIRDVKRSKCVKDLGYYESALELAIEALKRVKKMRTYKPAPPGLLLPGETEE